MFLTSYFTSQGHFKVMCDIRSYQYTKQLIHLEADKQHKAHKFLAELLMLFKRDKFNIGS